MTSSTFVSEFRNELGRFLRLYAVTDRTWIGVQTLMEQIESTLVGGATAVQLREKDLCEELFIREAVSVKKLCERYNVPLIVNDNVQVALKSGADGVHLGQDDMCLEEARRILGENKIIGISVHSTDEAIQAEKGGADYIGIGAIFSTQTKRDVDTISLDRVSQICESTSLPAVAIGGIKDENMDCLQGLGVVGIAVVSAIFAQPDVEIATFELRNHVDRIFS